MKIIVTGSSGYLGGRLVEHLIKAQPESQLCLINRKPVAVADQRIKSFSFQNVNAHDIRGAKALFHLAGPNAQACQDFFEDSLQSKIQATKHLLDMCREENVPFRYFSSAHVYGQLTGDISEQTPCQPLHLYGYLHRVTEELCEFYQRQYKLPVSIFRLSNALGAPADPEVHAWSLICNDLCRQAVEKGALHLKSNGQQLRSFIGIGDFCNTVDFTLKANLQESTYNWAGPAISVKELAFTIQRIYEQNWKKQLEVHFQDSSSSSSVNPHLNISSQKWLAQGVPQFGSSLEKEITETLAFCLKHFKQI